MLIASWLRGPTVDQGCGKNIANRTPNNAGQDMAQKEDSMSTSEFEIRAREVMARFAAGLVVKLPGAEHQATHTFVLMPQSNGWWTLMQPAPVGGAEAEPDWEVDPRGRIIADCFETPFWAFHLELTEKNLLSRMDRTGPQGEISEDGVVDLAKYRSRQSAQALLDVIFGEPR